jgi:hypothetical protein
MVIGAVVPVIVPRMVSVVVRVWLPAVLRVVVAVKVWLPLSAPVKVVLAGRTAWASLEVKWTVPV